MTDRNDHWPLGPAELVRWAESYQETMEREPPDVQRLLSLLAQARLTAKTATAVEEWLLMAAREEGATLEGLAEITGASRKYVRGPAKRLGRLAEQYGSPQARLSALHRRILGDAPAADH
ncbi:MAG: hypothetical protein ACRDRN_05825 [Sciscionella sp.]